MTEQQQMVMDIPPVKKETKQKDKPATRLDHTQSVLLDGFIKSNLLKFFSIIWKGKNKKDKEITYVVYVDGYSDKKVAEEANEHLKANTIFNGNHVEYVRKKSIGVIPKSKHAVVVGKASSPFKGPSQSEKKAATLKIDLNDPVVIKLIDKIVRDSTKQALIDLGFKSSKLNLDMT